MRDRRTKIFTSLAGVSVLAGILVWLGVEQHERRRLSEAAAEYERTRARCVDEVRVVSDQATTKQGKVPLARLDRSSVAQT